jgi:hypothetical protein
MSSFNPNPMLAAQMISYAKGQENQTRFSGEKKEEERRAEMALKQEKEAQARKKPASLKEGILA